MKLFSVFIYNEQIFFSLMMDLTLIQKKKSLQNIYLACEQKKNDPTENGST